MAITEDPYFAGQTAQELASGKLIDARKRPPYLAWSLVYIANLVVPLYLGTAVTDGSGRVGMAIGVVVVFAIGCRVCVMSRWSVLTVVYGGWIVAISQFMPCLQSFAGMMGVGTATALGLATNPRGDHVNSGAGGIVATLVTGFLLLLAATIAGLLIRGVMKLSRGPSRSNSAGKPFEVAGHGQ